MSRVVTQVLVMATILVCGEWTLAQDDDTLGALLALLDEKAAKITDLSATFTQEKHTAILRRPLVSSGTVRVRPPLVRWDTDRPHASKMLVSQKEVRIFYPDQATVEIYDLAGQLGQLAASPIFRLAALREHFTIERAAPREGEKPVAGRVELRLTPRAQALRDHIQEIRLGVDEDSALVRRVEIVNSDGERTVMTFDRIKVNPGLVPGALALEIPSGTNIVRPLAPDPGNRGDGP